MPSARPGMIPVAMALVIDKVDHESEPVRRRLIDYLAPHETRALFLIGNLVNGYAGAHFYYLARDGNRHLGLAGYFERLRSASLFAEDPFIVRALVTHLTQHHPHIDFVNAIESIGLPASDQMQALGYLPANDPHQTFMELAIPDDFPRVPHEEFARPIDPGDAEAAALLMRALHSPDRTGPVTEAELTRVLMNPQRMVLEINGHVVSTATTNGVGVHAFQILGVSTSPACRNRGYARAVCAALIRKMQATRNATHAVLFTGLDNAAAQRCYQSLGFRTTGTYYMAKFQPKA